MPAPRYALPCGEPRQAERKSATNPSEDCGKRHEKTSTTASDDWIVRGDSTTGGWAGPSASSGRGTNTNHTAGATSPSPCAARADYPAGHRERGWQRGDVYDDLRVAGGGL